ncbi:MAG: hypothetical protein HY904_21565 [Deltaproteobacteria bacterium]|nr:hypothetical protein [Deltaproteobacteria bacterium]
MARIPGVFGVAAVAVLGGLAAGCGGCRQPATGCDNGGCPAGQSCVDGECQPSGASSSSSGGMAYCESDADCGADEECSLAINGCISKHDCETAADCREGQECRDFDGDGYRDCGYPGCTGDAECITEMAGSCTGDGNRARCVERACVCQGACGGDCGTGKVCCGVKGGACGAQDACCLPDPGPCATLECSPGSHGVSSTTTAWSVDLCDYAGSNCECQELPPLPLGVIGNPSAIGVDGQDRLWIAAYDYGPYAAELAAAPPYGDLVVGLYNAATSRIDWQFVDGVPLGAPVEGGPSGPRGGIAEPGNNMGRYLDMAVAPDGTVHVAYQDATAGTLRYARVQGGAVTSFTLDAQRETGVYPALALDPSTGAPRVAWLTRRDDSGAAPMARLVFAAATGAAPGAATDFVVHTLTEVDLTTVPCEGGCAEGFRCQVDTVRTPACHHVDTNCAASCGTGQFCTGGACVDEVPGSALRDVPQGPGVWAAMLVRNDGKPFLAVHDTVDGTLKVYSTEGGDPPDSPSARFTSLTVAAAGQVTGLWPSVAVDASGVVKVAHVNQTTHALRLVTLGAALTLQAEETVDDAGRQNGQATDLHRLAEPALVIRGDGAELVSYQDGTTGELLLATRSGGAFTRSTLAGGRTGVEFNGFFGFSTDAVGRGNNPPVISTFRHNPDPTPPDDGLVLINWP